MLSKSVMYAPLLKDTELEDIEVKEDITDISNDFNTVVNTTADQCDGECDESNVDDQALSTYDAIKENEVSSVMVGNLTMFARKLGRSLATADMILKTQVHPAVKKLMEDTENEISVQAKQNNVVLNDVDPIEESNVDMFDWKAHSHSEISEEVRSSVLRDKLNILNTDDVENKTVWMSLNHSNFDTTPFTLTDEAKAAYKQASAELHIDPSVVDTVLNDLGNNVLRKLNAMFIAGNGSNNYLECLYLADELVDTYIAADLLRNIAIDVSDDYLAEIKAKFDDYVDCCILATIAVRTMRVMLRNSVIVMIRETGHYTFNPDTLQDLENIGWTQADVCKYVYCRFKNQQLPPYGVTLDDLNNAGSSDNAKAQFEKVRSDETQNANAMRLQLTRKAILTVFPRTFKTLNLLEDGVEITPEDDININNEAVIAAGTVDNNDDLNLESLAYQFIIHLCYRNTLVDKLYYALSDEISEVSNDAGDLTDDDLATMKTSAYAKVVSRLLVDNVLNVK